MLAVTIDIFDVIPPDPSRRGVDGVFGKRRFFEIYSKLRKAR